MKYILPILTLVLFAFSSQTSAENMAKETMAKPNTTVVAFHADWCGGCKILGPKMEKVMNSLDDETKAKFTKVKFDFTDDTTKAASKAMAEEKGFAGIFPGEGKPPTGVLKIIDNETGTVLAKIHYKMSEEEIIGTLKAVTSRS